MKRQFGLPLSQEVIEQWLKQRREQFEEEIHVCSITGSAVQPECLSLQAIGLFLPWSSTGEFLCY